MGLIGISSPELSGHDEPRVAGIAREMALRDDYAVPRLNGRPFLEYPSLGYLPQALLSRLTGRESEFLAVLPTLLFALGTVWLTYRMGCLLGGERVGLNAGFLLQTTAEFLNLHRKCLVDPALLFFITFSLYGFLAWHSGGSSVRYRAFFYLGLSGAFLTKGLVGVGLPAAVVLVFLLLAKDWTALKKLLLGWPIVFFFLPIALWGYEVDRSGGLGLVEEVLRQSVQRFLSSSADHSNPPWYYLAPLSYMFVPWILIPIFLLWLRFGPAKWEEGFSLGRENLFPKVWFLTITLVLLLAAAKRKLYLAPLLPAFALLASVWWERIRIRLAVPRKREIAVLAGFLPLMAVVQFGFLLPREREESFREIFQLVKKEQAGAQVVLYSPSEAMRGANVFYLGRVSPVIGDPEGIRSYLTEGSKKIFVVSVGGNLEDPFEGTKTLHPVYLLGSKKMKSRRVSVYSTQLPGR